MESIVTRSENYGRKEWYDHFDLDYGCVDYRKVGKVNDVLSDVFMPQKYAVYRIYGYIYSFSTDTLTAKREIEIIGDFLYHGKGRKIRHFCIDAGNVYKGFLENGKFEEMLKRVLRYTFRYHPVYYVLHDHARRAHIHVLVLSVNTRGELLDMSRTFWDDFLGCYSSAMGKFYRVPLAKFVWYA